MSSHFAASNAAAAAEAAADTSNKSAPTRFFYWCKRIMSFYPDDLSNPNHRRLRTQAGIRGGVVLAMFLYLGYLHPEYSFLSAWYHGSSKPLAQQRFEKLSGGATGADGQPAVTERDVANIMSGSQRTTVGSSSTQVKKPW